MKKLNSWIYQIQSKYNSFRYRLLIANIIIIAVLGYVKLKFPAKEGLHQLARLYSQGDLTAIDRVKSWSTPFLIFLQSLELSIDTLLFIPAYSLGLLVWAAHYAKSQPIVSRRNWFILVLSWLAPWLPILIIISVISDLIENSCLLYLATSHTFPLSPAVTQLLQVIKLYPLGLVATYVLLGFLLSKPASVFLSKILFYIWLIFKVITLNKYIRCGVAMLRTVWPVCIVLIITYLFLNVMDQVSDLLYSLINDQKYSVCVFACLLVYALVVWYSTRIIFILKDQRYILERVDPSDDDNEELSQLITFKNERDVRLVNQPDYAAIDIETLRDFTRWTPVVLGLFPFIAFLVALNKVEETTLHQLALVIEALVYLAITHQVKNYVESTTADDRNIHPHLFSELRLVHRRNLRIALVSGILLVVLASIWITNLAISRFLGPISIVFLALTMWVMIASFFSYLDYHYKAPFTLICLLIMMFMNNNNHQIRTVNNNKGSYFSKDTATQSIPIYFQTWLDHLIAYRASKKYTDTQIPIYLISSEGGGIRSAYWTAKVLRQLDSTQQGFFRHVFAISGVSGGSVGAAVYTAQYRDNLLTQLKDTTLRFTFDIDKFFKRDYLSPLLTAMLIPDMLQKFSPVTINSVDRAQYLEDGWADAYKDEDVQMIVPKKSKPDNSFLGDDSICQKATLNKPFFDLWDDPRTRYDIPVLFLNSTQAETGRKGLITPLVIQNNPQFDNVIDIQEEVYRHIPLNTAASMSARFPIVTPPATVRVVNEPSVDSSNFVDGGYIDNSGTSTLLSILSSITSNKQLVDSLKAKHIVFRIISINNSVESDPNRQVKSLTGLYELKAPLLAFFESWDNSGDYRRYAVKEYARGFSGAFIYPNDKGLISEHLYSINLNRKTGVIPLGWDLSEQAEARIQEQSRKLGGYFRDPKRYPSFLTGFEADSTAHLSKKGASDYQTKMINASKISFQRKVIRMPQ